MKNKHSQTLKSNGYGSFEQRLVVRVENAYVDVFAEAFGVQAFRRSDEGADFIVQTSSTRRGDDETIMYEIDYTLPESMEPFKGWKVLWDESSY